MTGVVPESRLTSSPSQTSGEERVAAAVVLVILLTLYAATLAPDVTLWDAGEFNAAVATLGVPHPPGTPLYILLGRAWSMFFGWLPQAVAMNALSAVATAAGCGMLAGLLARWTRSVWAGISGGIAAGAMFAVWQNATETEVYALSLCMAILFIVVGDRAGVLDSDRHRRLLVYLLALSVAVQISALVAAPAALYLAATPGHQRTSVPGTVLLGGALLAVIGVGVASPLLLVAGLVVLGSRAILPDRWWSGAFGPVARGRGLEYAALIALGASAMLFMLVRAAHDPGVNQGNPQSWDSFVDVIARTQYDVPPLWPRRAPLWIQLGNLFQYADWQVAYGLDNDVAASWLRTPWSLLFGALSVVGARWHWRRHVRSARSLALLLFGATIGVVAVLNLRAGPSIGIGILPPSAGHEPRERDYFFALAFAVAALWAGAGAASIAARFGARRAWIGVMAAMIPVALNWRLATRRYQPDAALSAAMGAELLRSSPSNAVLLLAGDNDSYAVWYEQRVHGLRRDVTPVTLPLLGAGWYRDELARRDSLLSKDEQSDWLGEAMTLRAIAAAARRNGRPVAAAVSVPRETRQAVARLWHLSGLVLALSWDPAAGLGPRPTDSVDLAATRASAQRLATVPRLGERARDPTSAYVARLLSCPKLVVAAVEGMANSSVTSLDSHCNLK